MPQSQFPDDSPEPEIDLLKRIAEGDRQSFAALYDRFVHPLLAAAFNITRHQEAAEDVVQEVFLQIWKKASFYNPSRGRPLTWAITLTRNKAIDRLRSIQRHHRLITESESEREAAPPVHRQDSARLAALRESSALVRSAIEHLPADQRKVIEMAYFSDLKLAEIANILNEALPTVKGRLRRGLLRLRASLDIQEARRTLE